MSKSKEDLSRILREAIPIALLAFVVTMANAAVALIGTNASAPKVFIFFVLFVVVFTQAIAILSQFGQRTRAAIEYIYYSLVVVAVFLLFLQMDQPRDLVALQSASDEFSAAKNQYSFECRKEALARDPTRHAYSVYLQWAPRSAASSALQAFSELYSYVDKLCLAAHAETEISWKGLPSPEYTLDFAEGAREHCTEMVDQPDGQEGPDPMNVFLIGGQKKSCDAVWSLTMWQAFLAGPDVETFTTYSNDDPLSAQKDHGRTLEDIILAAYENEVIDHVWGVSVLVVESLLHVLFLCLSAGGVYSSALMNFVH